MSRMVAVADIDGVVEILEHGWLTWSPTGWRRPGDPSPRPVTEIERAMVFRSRPDDDPALAHQYVSEGFVVVRARDGLHVIGSVDPARTATTLGVDVRDGTALVFADGPVRSVFDGAADLDAAVSRWLTGTHSVVPAAASTPVPVGWCSWYCYWFDITEDAIRQELAAMRRLGLDTIDVVQIDDGYAPEVGDWSLTRPGFGSLNGAVSAIRDSGRRAGIWCAPFLAGVRSTIVKDRPDWFLDSWAGHHWGQDLRALDCTREDVRDYLRGLVQGWCSAGIDYIKLDFLFAGALPADRPGGVDPVQAYRAALTVIREAAGPAVTLVGCGAPQLPSIGLVDVMRVSPDVTTEEDKEGHKTIDDMITTGSLRQAFHRRLWVNDPDCLVAAPHIPARDRVAAHVLATGGSRVCSDRLDELDDHGLDLTRRILTAG